MRTTKALVCAAAVAAGAISAMAQSNVYSLNVVGYVNLTFPAGGKYTAICNPLNAPTNTLGALIGTNLPVNGQVLKWNYASSKFDIFKRIPIGNGWSPSTAADVSLNPGEGCFVQTPTTTTTDIVNTFVGEVLQGNMTNSLASGYTLAGNMVPDSGSITNLGLNIPYSASPANQLLKWNITDQKYDIYKRVPIGSGWSPSIPVLNVGDGFFTVLAAPVDWVRNFNVQ